MSQIIKEIEAQFLKSEIPEFQVGDTVKISVLIREGKKERIQAFEGVVIARSGGGVNESFTVRKIVQGVAVERTFMLNAPKVAKIQVLRKGKTRRAKLYYLRNRVGTKATRLKEDIRRVAKERAEKEAAKAAAKKQKLQKHRKQKLQKHRKQKLQKHRKQKLQKHRWFLGFNTKAKIFYRDLGATAGVFYFLDPINKLGQKGTGT